MREAIKIEGSGVELAISNYGPGNGQDLAKG